MILPTTYQSALLLLIVSLLCWGSWANTLKLSGKWRFEFYYYDFTLGVLIAALAAAFTLGSLNSVELTFQDNLLLAGTRKMAMAVASGFVFNLANLLLVGAVAVAGMAVAFPVGLGLAIIMGVIWNFILNPQSNPTILFGGALVLLLAVIASGMAYATYLKDQRTAAQQALTPDPRAKTTRKKAGAAKGLLLAVLGGLLMGAFFPMLEDARAGETGVSPYGAMLLLAGGAFLSTIVYIPFFLNFPVIGKPLPMTAYFRSTKGQHVLGLLGGFLWMAGGLSSVVAASSPAALQLSSGLTYALGQGTAVVSALWGLLVWREFKGATFRVNVVMMAVILLFVIGLGMVAIAPGRGR